MDRLPPATDFSSMQLPNDLPSAPIATPMGRPTKLSNRHAFEIALSTAKAGARRASKIFPQGIMQLVRGLHDAEVAKRQETLSDRRLMVRAALILSMFFVEGGSTAVQGPSSQKKPHAQSLNASLTPERLLSERSLSSSDEINVDNQTYLDDVSRIMNALNALPSPVVPESVVHTAALSENVFPLSPEQISEARMLAQQLLKDSHLNALAVGSVAALETDVGKKSAIVLGSRVLITTRKNLVVDDQAFRLMKVHSGPRFDLQESWSDGEARYSIESDPSGDLVVIVFDRDIFHVKKPLPFAQTPIKDGEPLVICGSPHGGLRQRVAGWSQGKNLDTAVPLEAGMDGSLVMNKAGELVGIAHESLDHSPKLQLVSEDVVAVLIGFANTAITRTADSSHPSFDPSSVRRETRMRVETLEVLSDSSRSDDSDRVNNSDLPPSTQATLKGLSRMVSLIRANTDHDDAQEAQAGKYFGPKEENVLDGADPARLKALLETFENSRNY